MANDKSRKGDALDDVRKAERKRKEAEEKARKAKDNRPNPPFTTKHGITAPKFGSAGSGGAEYEPGPEKD